IARRWQVPMGQLIKVNEVGPREILAVGRQLVIPVATNHPVGALPQSRSDIRKITYRVRRGDSLSRIAQRFGIGIGDIERWNSLDRRRYLQPGQRLTLYVDALGS
ncbi:MAG TPA: lytic transglycosylase, partial [Gammaproteobacteria bacterium]|nr:lytic transglycosylase [Gammaproteobacteria bacterium]